MKKKLGTVDHMFLLKMLEKHNMTIDDIEFTNMTINDAGPAFLAGSDRVMKSSSSAVQKVVNSWFDGVELLNKRDKNFIQSIADDAELSYEEYEKK